MLSILNCGEDDHPRGTYIHICCNTTIVYNKVPEVVTDELPLMSKYICLLTKFVNKTSLRQLLSVAFLLFIRLAWPRQLSYMYVTPAGSIPANFCDGIRALSKVRNKRRRLLYSTTSILRAAADRSLQLEWHMELSEFYV